MGLRSSWRRLLRWTLRDPQVREILGPPPVAAGVAVTPDSALALSAVFNAVTILSGTVASLPLLLYRRRGDSRERAEDHPLWRLLHDAPNPLMTSFSWRERMMVHLLLWGNSFDEVVRDRAGRVVALWPLMPWQVTVRPDGESGVSYEVRDKAGSRVLSRAEVLHIAGLGFDGVVGRSVIAVARESLGLGLAAQEYGARFFGSGAHLSGVLEYPGVLSDDARRRLREEWTQAYSGVSRAHRVAILEEGLKFSPISIPPDDAQFLQTREFQIEEIARWFNLPPHMLKDLRRGTYANVEHQAIEFLRYSLLPWLRRIESQIGLQLLDGTDLYAEHLIEGLLRGDTESRYRAYAIARQWGWLSANDVRRLENLDPVPGGDAYLVPLNMVPVDGGGEGSRGLARALLAPAERRAEPRPPWEERLRLRRALRTVVRDAAGRLLTREIADLRRAVGRLQGERIAADLEAELEEVYRRLGPAIARDFRAVTAAIAEAIVPVAAREIGGELDPAELSEFAQELAESVEERWLETSRGQLRALTEESLASGGDVAAAIQQRLDEWEASRADRIADLETVRLSEATARQTWVAVAGVMLAVRWVTAGAENCPYCEELAAMERRLADAFGVAEDVLAPPNVPPMRLRRLLRHPPAHEGCDCMLVPAVAV